MLGNMWYTLLHFSFPFFLPDKPYPFNQRHPFNCLLSLSRHFPLLLLCPFAPFFSLFLLILLLFYFCQHMVSQLSLSSLPSYLLSAFAFIFVLEIKLSDFPVQTHTCTLCHAPAEECASHLHSPSSLPSFLYPQFFTYSPPPSCSAHYLHLSSSCLCLYFLLSFCAPFFAWILSCYILTMCQIKSQNNRHS